MAIIDSVKLEKYRKAVALYKQGKSYKEIAKEVRISFSGIKEAIEIDVQGKLYRPVADKDGAAATITAAAPAARAGATDRSPQGEDDHNKHYYEQQRHTNHHQQHQQKKSSSSSSSSLSAVATPASPAKQQPLLPPDTSKKTATGTAVVCAPSPSPPAFSKEEIEIERLRRLSDKEKVSEAYRFFSLPKGEKKTPVEVAIMLGLRLDFVNQLYKEYLAAEGLYRVGEIADRIGNNRLGKLAKVYGTIRKKRLTIDQVASYIEFTKDIYDAGSSLERLRQEEKKKRAEVDALNARIENEFKPRLADFEKRKAELAEVEQRAKELRQKYPQLTAAEVAEKIAKQMIDDRVTLLRAALGAIIEAVRSDPSYGYLIYPNGNKQQHAPPDFVYYHPNGPQRYEEMLKEIGVRLGEVFYIKIVNMIMSEYSRLQSSA